MSTTQTTETTSWLDRPIAEYLPRLTLENILAITIIILAIVSRFYGVGMRSMSHDEVNHVVPAFDLYEGRGYRHDPITHGPLQFHLLALSYFLFGDNDTSARIPAALFSVATVAFVLFGFRRYLGRSGALLAGLFFLISPYLLFYGRYTRNEAFVALFGVMMIYATLRHLDRGDAFSLYLLAAALSLQFVTKETAFIYTAQLLLFLGILFLIRMDQARWKTAQSRSFAIGLTIASLGLFGVGLGLAIADAANKKTAGSESMSPLSISAVVLVIIGLILGIMLLFHIVKSLGWKRVRAERSFELLVLVGTLILPQLAAFPIKMVGTLLGQDWNPMDYTSTAGIIRIVVTLVILFLASTAIGLWWKPRIWVTSAIIFYGIFVVFYTTFFTNVTGFFSGIIGSLGYWLEQQGEVRGSQPLYYYLLLQVPIYEYLGAFGTLVAAWLGVKYRKLESIPGISPTQPDVVEDPVTVSREEYADPELHDLSLADGNAVTVQMVEEWIQSEEAEEPMGAPAEEIIHPKAVPTLALLLFWSVLSLLAYSLAGERMPWLTVHIALPLALAAGWGFGFLVDSIPWKKIITGRDVLGLALIPVFWISLAAVAGRLLGNQPPFQGKELTQLTATNSFLFAILVLAGSIWLISQVFSDWNGKNILRLGVLGLTAILAFLTARTAYTANYINYDNAREFLVYAHGTGDFKRVVNQVEEISRRTTDGLNAVVAYDNDALYAGWWYFRHYPNKIWYNEPSRSLQDAAMIIVSEENYAAIEPVVRDDYIRFDYVRLWWPMQDYMNLTWERIKTELANRDLRTALFQIWLNRDYTLYAQTKGIATLTLETWQPAARMRFYVRRDIAQQIWNYGLAETPIEDPYKDKTIDLKPDLALGGSPESTLQFNRPHGLAFAPDGTLYVADSGNHRILHISTNGEILHSWGTFADQAAMEAPGGTFNEPWGIAVSQDGTVYVTDTWNHRVQKFTGDGQFLEMWGYFGQDINTNSFWGPRGIAVDDLNRIYVADTGNKRISIFLPDGQLVAQFGTPGMGTGQLDEPVGIAVAPNGNVYIADTWNRRVQVFQPDSETGTVYTSISQWDVRAWFGQSLENKPFLALDTAGNVYLTDPEGYRIIELSPEGETIRVWGDYSTTSDGLGLASAVAIDAEGHIWVSDAANNRILRYTLP